MTTKSVTYVGQKELNAGTEKERGSGWRVVSVTEVRQPVGATRIATIGVGAIFIKPKPHYYVVYERDAQPPAQGRAGSAEEALRALEQALRTLKDGQTNAKDSAARERSQREMLQYRKIWRQL